MSLKQFISLLALGLTGILLFACARIGSPPGGDKDETPPEAISSDPANYATSYNQKKIKITFDEFIQLKSVFSEFTVSPPLEEKPVPLVRGKSIVFDFPSSDLDSLTYTMDFGQAIVDNNEGNKLLNFQFVISKQAHIDSFSVSGVVVDAFSKKPDEETIFVHLRNNLSDSAFRTVIPTYIGKTDPEGKFNINHIAPGVYNVFALKDANNNMLYDMPTEVLAFNNEPIHLHPDSFAKMSIGKHLEVDSNAIQSDTLLLDSIFHSGIRNDTMSDSTQVADSSKLMVYGYSFNLFTFAEAEEYDLFLEEHERKVPESLAIYFSEKMDTLPTFNLIKPDTVGQWHYLEDNPTHDSLVLWLADSNLVNKDSIIIEIIHPITDSTGELIMKTDTLLFRYKTKKKQTDKSTDAKKGGLLGRIGKKDDKIKDTLPVPIPRMSIQDDINKSAQDLNASINLLAGAPVLINKPELIELFRMEDTIEVPDKFRFLEDSTNFRRFKIYINYEPSTRYKLRLYEGVFQDIYGRTIDSTEFQFTTQEEEFYGTIHVEMPNISEPTILNLLNEKEELVRKYRLYKSQKVRMDFIHPGKYSLKVIYDENDNGKWDTGKFDDYLQPEHVEFFPQVVEVISNMDSEYTWELFDTITNVRPEDKKEDEEKNDDKKVTTPLK